MEMPERHRIYSNAFLCRLAGPIAIQLLVLTFLVFNPGDLYFNNNNNMYHYYPAKSLQKVLTSKSVTAQIII